MTKAASRDLTCDLPDTVRYATRHCRDLTCDLLRTSYLVSSCMPYLVISMVYFRLDIGYWIEVLNLNSCIYKVGYRGRPVKKIIFLKKFYFPCIAKYRSFDGSMCHCTS